MKKKSYHTCLAYLTYEFKRKTLTATLQFDKKTKTKNENNK